MSASSRGVLRSGLRGALPIGTRYGALGVQFLVVAVITRQLSPGDAGNYLAFSGAIQSSFFLAGLGVPDGLVRTVSRARALGDHDRARKLLRRGAAFSIVTSPVLALTVGLIGWVTSGSAAMGSLLALWWCAYAFVFVGSQALVASSRPQAGVFVFYGLVNLGLLVVLVPALLTGAANSLIATMLFTVLGAYAALAVLGSLRVADNHVLIRSYLRNRVRAEKAVGRQRSESHRPDILSSFRPGVPIALNRVVQAGLIWSPVWVSGVVFGPSSAALVGVGSRLTVVVGAALAAVNFAIRPTIVDDATSGMLNGLRSRMARVSVLAGAITLAAMALNAFIGKELMSALFGDQYEKVYLVFAILLVVSFGEAIAGASGEVIKMIGRPSWLLRAQLLTLFIAVLVQAQVGYSYGLWHQLWSYAIVLVAYYVFVAAKARRLTSAYSEKVNG